MSCEVTVFKRVKSAAGHSAVWEKTVYEAKSVSCEELSDFSGERSIRKNRLTARFFGELPEVQVGDMMVMGASDGDEPPSEASIICSVRKNLRGSDYIRHMKIIAEG